VRVLVTEAWHYLPVLSLSFTEGQAADVRSLQDVFDLATIMVGFADINFRGDAARLYALGQFGAAEGVSLAYDTRWLSPALPISTTLRFQNMRIADRHASVLDSSRRMHLARASVQAGTRRGAVARYGAELRYDVVHQEYEWPAEGRSDRTVWLTPYVGLDRRKLEWYPGPGSFADVRTSVVMGTANFLRTQAELRGYIGIDDGWPLHDTHRPALLALRARAGTTSAHTPSWAHYYSGFSEGFRGYRRAKFEAANYLAGEAELRAPLLKESTYNLSSLGRYGKRLPFGVSTLFAVERFEQQLDGRRDNGLAVALGFLFRVPIMQILEWDFEWNRAGEFTTTFSSGVRF
jgi:hypothetical protein